jgi:hypothetical protein
MKFECTVQLEGLPDDQFGRLFDLIDGTNEGLGWPPAAWFSMTELGLAGTERLMRLTVPAGDVHVAAAAAFSAVWEGLGVCHLEAEGHKTPSSFKDCYPRLLLVKKLEETS